MEEWTRVGSSGADRCRAGRWGSKLIHVATAAGQTRSAGTACATRQRSM